MKMRHAVFLCAALCLIVAAGARSGPPVDKGQLPPTYVPTGKVMYKDYCAACHGPGAKGDGPTAPLLKVRPADLTTLTKRHDGMFPYEYVSSVLRFGTGPTILHGTSDMPTWGPIFHFLDKNEEKVVVQRIKNLSEYLASLQVK